MKKHWTERLFVEKAGLYMATLEEIVEKASLETEGLVNMLSDFQVHSGSLILDLACGIGRHSVLLAESGFRVVGVDLSPMFIARAREIAAESGVGERVEFRVGDMRSIAEVLKGYAGKFKAVVSLFTSMGYYDEETDIRIMNQLLKLTAPNGTFIIDIVNRDWLVRHFQAKDITYWENGRVMVAERRLDLERSRMFNVWRYYRQREEDLEHLETIELDHRVYSLHELKRLVEESGWTYVTSYGGFNSEPFTMDSRRIVLVASKT